MTATELNPPDELRRAVAEFNAGQYFECHETLEALWMQEDGAIRDFYQGLIQLAVALHHAARGNQRGAEVSLLNALERLRRAPPVCQGIDAAALLTAAERWRVRSAQGGAIAPDQGLAIGWAAGSVQSNAR